MSDPFTEPVIALVRRVALLSPGRSPSSFPPVKPPAGLEPPVPVPEAENGYAMLKAHVADWPSEGHHPPDLSHRLKTVAIERAAAAEALRPLRPILEELDPIFAAPRWQVTEATADVWPEAGRMRRLGQALLLRGSLEGRREDWDQVLFLARRLRRSEGPFLHFLIGVSLERLAQGDFEGIETDRAEAVRWELARFIVPRLHEGGPWDPEEGETTPAYADARRSVRWALARHPSPYDPEATLEMILAERGLMAKGSSEALNARAEALGRPWPQGLRATHGFGPGRASLSELWQARRELAQVSNPYGRLSVARLLRTAANLSRVVEKAKRA